jgi:hypothetical protein
MSTRTTDDFIRRLGDPVTAEYAERMGRDAAINGPNTTNCHFRIFTTRELTEAWERGYRSAKKEAKP